MTDERGAPRNSASAELDPHLPLSTGICGTTATGTRTPYDVVLFTHGSAAGQMVRPGIAISTTPEYQEAKHSRLPTFLLTLPPILPLLYPSSKCPSTKSPTPTPSTQRKRPPSPAQ